MSKEDKALENAKRLHQCFQEVGYEVSGVFYAPNGPAQGYFFYTCYPGADAYQYEFCFDEKTGLPL